MAVAKTIEIIAGSNSGLEDAVREGIAKASESVEGIQSAWVKDIKLECESGRITEWRVGLKVTFVVK